MDRREELKKKQEILESIFCFNSLEDEVLKLFCLVTMAEGRVFEEQEYFSKEYMQEKVKRILDRIPIILDASAQHLFCSLKIKLEKPKGYK